MVIFHFEEQSENQDFFTLVFKIVDENKVPFSQSCKKDYSCQVSVFLSEQIPHNRCGAECVQAGLNFLFFVYSLVVFLL